ncbi:hypothetical protein SMITH_541 [Smithella sp. ME-1]|nr:hypothetical protein SMITH_541 [Smithella sp. ME-1]
MYLLLGNRRGNKNAKSEVFVASVSILGNEAMEFCLLPSAFNR